MRSLYQSGADLAFFQGGGGGGGLVHEPRSGEPIFFAILNLHKWCFPGIY